MISGTLAKRYARALLSLANNGTERDRYLTDLEKFAAASRTSLAEGGHVGRLLDATHVGLQTRLGIARKLNQRLGLSPNVGKFIELLVERGRADGAVLIARQYRDLADMQAGRVRAQVRSAKTMAPDAVNKLKTALEKATGKTVVLEQEIEPELIGGFVTQVGSYTLDRSVRSSLQRLRSGLKGM